MARRLDSCRQCVRRRIQCDAQMPQCSKCARKGIECSGIGKQYRFVPVETRQKDDRSRIVAKKSNSSQRSSASEKPLGDGSTKTIRDDLLNRNIAGWQYSFEILDSDSRLWFDYFSLNIASSMVIIDEPSTNGYRSILLPLATEDDMVRRAICAISKLHLANKHPEKLYKAEAERTAVIRRLQHNASQESLENIFNISTWTTLIILMLGAKIAGHQGFVHLFKMLKNYLNHPRSSSIAENHEAVRRFLQEQSYLYINYAPPFLGLDFNSKADQSLISDHLDELISRPSSKAAVQHLYLLKNGIALCGELSLGQFEKTLDSTEIDTMIRKLISILAPINETTHGAHSFIWCYFVGGASSTNPEHRAFFLERLYQVYRITRMRNVTETIEILERIWESPSTQNWTQRRMEAW